MPTGSDGKVWKFAKTRTLNNWCTASPPHIPNTDLGRGPVVADVRHGSWGGGGLLADT